MNLEVITKNVDFNSCIKQFDLSRPTIKNSNTTLKLLEVKTIKNWSKNLKDVPAIENHDVMIYLYNSCHWDERRLRNYNSDNVYRLHQANHIIGVEVGRVPDTTYRFINI